MPVSSTTTLSGLAKELYPLSEIKDMEQRVTAYKMEVDEAEGLEFSAASGGTFKFPVKASGPHGQKMMNEQEALPTARTSNVVQGTAAVKEYAGVLQFTKRELELAKGDAKSFANAKTFEMEGLIEQAHKYFNRQMVAGTGVGTMTLVQGTQTAQTQIEVDDASPFMIGQVLDIWNSAGTAKQASSIVVTDIDLLSSPNSITVDTTTTCDDNGIITLAGLRDNMATDGKEMFGLSMATDDGTDAATFQGITRTGAGEVPNYRGIEFSVGGPISVEAINRLCTRSLRMAGTDFVKSNDCYFLFSPEQWRSYASLAVPQVRFQPTDSADFNKPYTQYECMGKRVVIDTDLERTRVYLIKKSAAKLAVAAPLDWEEDLGGTSLKWLSGYAQGIMLLYALMQHFFPAPRDMAALVGLTSVDI